MDRFKYEQGMKAIRNSSLSEERKYNAMYELEKEFNRQEYIRKQNAITKKYQENSFLYFLDKKECYNTCSCYRNLAKLNEFSDILKSNFVQKYIKSCPNEESIPLKKESVLYDYLILKENEGKLFLRNKSAFVIEKQDDALTLQWKTTGKIEHYQYEKESGMFRLITK